MSGSAVTKVLYKPLSLSTSVLGGLLAGMVFNRVWRAIAKEDEAPEATALDHSTREVLLAAVLQGAVFGLVKAAVDRATARGYQRFTGDDPKR